MNEVLASPGWTTRVTAALARFWADQLELQERLYLLNHPWLEDVCHWVYGPDGWSLHGHLPPSAAHPDGSVTARGWCPGPDR